MAFIPYDSDFDDTKAIINNSEKFESNIISALCDVIMQLKLLNVRFEEAFETKLEEGDL